MNPSILVVDDDPEISRLLTKYLEGQGFRVSTEASAAGFASAVADGAHDLVVLDVMLPDGSGLDACRDYRARGGATPVVLLTALQEEVDRIIGLEIGADDYLGKPFSPRELVARIRAVLRRSAAPAPAAEAASAAYRFGGFNVEPDVRRVTGPDGSEIGLTGAEFDLLRVFIDRPGRILSREVLIEATHGRNGDPFDRSIDVLVSRLRRKLGETEGPLFKTVRNGGYQFSARVERSGPKA